MKNINQLTSDNLGGLQVCYYTHWDEVDFTQFPKRNGLSLLGDVVLKPGAKWGRIQFTFKTRGFNQPPKIDRRGTVYTHEVKGFLPKDTPELAELMYEMNAQRRYLVLHKDNNGHLKLSGGPDYGLTFESKFGTESSPELLNGYTAGFKGEGLEPALYYAGAIELTDQTIPAPLPPGGSGEPVKIIDALDNILEVVEPGGQYLVPSITSIEGGSLAAGDEQYTLATGIIIGEPLS